MTYKNCSTCRILSTFLALLMVFNIIAELAQPVSAAAPTITLKKITNIYDGSIYVTGQLKCTRADKINSYGLLYGENDPAENKTVICSTKGNTYTGKISISKAVTGMEPGKTYVCCLYAETDGGTLYKSESMTFTSSSVTLSQPQADNVTYKGAKLTASYTQNGSCPVKEVGFYYGTDESCQKKAKASKKSTFSVSLSGLESGKTYYYYAYFISNAGFTYKSEIQTFSTLSRNVTAVSLQTGDGFGKICTKFGNGVVKERTVYLYDEFTISAEVRPDYASNKKVTFSTSDENILKIKGSWVRAVAPGQATITATTEDGGLTASFLITVRDEPSYDEVPVITQAKSGGEDSVVLKWKRPSIFWDTVKVVYCVYRSESINGEFELIELTNQTSTTDEGLDPATTYYYKIQCYEKDTNLREHTYFSDVVSVTTDEHIYVPKKDKETTKTSESELPAEPDPAEPTPAQPDPDKSAADAAPTVHGLASAYTVEKGGKLSLRFTVEDAAGGIVEKVTVKHNVTETTCTASLTNSKSGVLECVFDIADTLFNNVGTYDFNVYARTTNFKVTDNCIGIFKVTVSEKVCKHSNYDDVYSRTVYTDTMLTDDKHTTYVVYDRTCNGCGAYLGEVHGTTETTGHTVNQKGYCSCGYIDVSGYKTKQAYNKTENSQNVYRNPESWSWYGTINADENVTVLGEWGDRYLIEYPLDNGGLKQGYVLKNVIEKVSENEETKPADNPSYSMYIDSRYFYNDFINESKSLLVGCIYESYKVNIIDAAGKNVSYSSNPDFKWSFSQNIGVTIDKYGTLCLTPGNGKNDTDLELYYKGKLQDKIKIMVAEAGTRFTNMTTILADKRWSEGSIAINNLCAATNFSTDYNTSTKEWKFSMDFYNSIPMVFAVASYTSDNELYRIKIIDGYWEDLSFTDAAVKAAVSTIDLFTGATFKGTSEADAKKTSVNIEVPNGGYVRTLYSCDSNYVFFANIAEFIFALIDTAEDFKEIFEKLDVKSIRECIDKELFIEKLEKELTNKNIADDLIKAFLSNSIESTAYEIINIFRDNKKLVENIVQLAVDCITSVGADDFVKTISKKAENVALKFVEPAYYIINAGEFGIDVIQSANLIKKNIEVFGIDNTIDEIGFCIWFPKK